jgi:glycosyltransferase involved in cell wall biosynthesis
VLAVSETTKRDIVELLKIPAEKIVVTPLGVDDHFHPPTPGEAAAFRAKHGIKSPFILTVSTLEPRKNLPRLLEAFEKIKEQIPHRLVIVGPEGWRTGALHDTIEWLDLGDRLQMTGFVPDDELPYWYAAADLFAFPSLYEGFGLTVLEAMACGAPVLTSNVSALPEVGGDAAVYVDPLSVDVIAEQLLELVTNDERRSALSAAGQIRAAEFKWERTARLTADSYRAAVR